MSTRNIELPVAPVGRYQSPARKPEELPLVSVILPVRNEEKAIARVLDSVRLQDYPRDKMEVIVADGMSVDQTRRIVLLAAAKDPRIRLVDNPRQIMAAGFNAGLHIARGEVIVMLGGHTELSPNYLRACSSALQRGLADCVGGVTRSTEGNTRVARAISLAMSSRFGVGGATFRVGCGEREYVDTVAFGAYSREAIERIGPLDEEFVRGQDDEFNYRLRKLGGRILIAPELTCSYTSRSSLASLWRQYFQYGYWKVRVLQKHPRQMQARQFAPAAFVGSLLFFLGLAMFRPAVGFGLALFLGIFYASVAIYESVSLAGREREWGLAPLVAVTFPVLHFSYGTGFLAGLAKFHRGWQSFNWGAGS
ncbi:MAG TPA: glycosyltransferase family 2 protein [Candidatus Acidoferrales bacterium]|nr:glycosyltransferase family 2 protein [Candidatus Acidoferrales bacterium]